MGHLLKQALHFKRCNELVAIARRVQLGIIIFTAFSALITRRSGRFVLYLPHSSDPIITTVRAL
jgi:hypothetical protein